MWKKIVSLGLTGLLITGCAFTPSRLNASRAQYDGMTVVVRGFVRLDTEAHFLYESKALYSEYENGRKSGNGVFDERKYGKYCVTIANPELLLMAPAAFDAKTIVVQGKFVANYLDGHVDDFGACALSTAIIIDNAALARRYRLVIPK